MKFIAEITTRGHLIRQYTWTGEAVVSTSSDSPALDIEEAQAISSGVRFLVQTPAATSCNFPGVRIYRDPT